MPNVLSGWPGKLLTIAGQLAGCAPTVTVGPVQLGITNDGGILGVSLNLTNPVPLSSGDTTLTLEVDASLDRPAPDAGHRLGDPAGQRAERSSRGRASRSTASGCGSARPAAR